MDTATTIATPRFQTLPRAALRVWPGNPRRTVTGVDELAKSVAASGVQVPLMVRPVTPPVGDVTHEVLAGQRRYLAAGAVGLAELPCLVHAVGDDVALEIAITENVRDDVPPLEEAEAIEALVTVHHRTPQEVADKLGRTLRWVQKRLSLLRLCPEARAQLAAGRFSIEHALRLAVVAPDVQLRVLARFVDATRIPSAAAFAQEVLYQLHDLAGAPFDVKDAALGGHGPCGACLHRSSAQGDLFGDVGTDDHCLDATCWDGKVSATWERATKGAKRRHLQVIEDGKELVHDAYDGKPRDAWNSPYTLTRTAEDAKPVALTRTAGGRVVELYEKPAEPTKGVRGPGSVVADAPTDREVEEERARKRKREAQRAKEREAIARVVAVARSSERAWVLLSRTALASLNVDFGGSLNLGIFLEVLGCPASKEAPEDDAIAAIPEEHLALALAVLGAQGRLESLLDEPEERETAAPFEKELLDLLNPPDAPTAAPGDTRERRVTVNRSVWQKNRLGLLDGKGLVFCGRWEAEGPSRVLTATPGPDLDAVLAFCAAHEGDFLTDVQIGPAEPAPPAAPEAPAKRAKAPKKAAKADVASGTARTTTRCPACGLAPPHLAVTCGICNKPGCEDCCTAGVHDDCNPEVE